MNTDLCFGQTAGSLKTLFSLVLFIGFGMGYYFSLVVRVATQRCKRYGQSDAGAGPRQFGGPQTGDNRMRSIPVQSSSRDGGGRGGSFQHSQYNSGY